MPREAAVDRLALQTRDADQLFRKHSVGEMRQYERLLAVHLDTHKQDVRRTIGQRYPDLLDAADSISAIQAAAERVCTSLQRCADACDAAGSGAAAGAAAGRRGRSPDARRQTQYAAAAQLKLLVETPEQIWHALEHGRLVAAAVCFLRGRALFKALQNGQQALAATGLVVLPVAQRQWESVSHFRAQIADRARQRAGAVGLGATDAARALAAVLLAETRSSASALERFLALRAAAATEKLQHAVADASGGSGETRASPGPSIAAAGWENVLEAASILRETLELVRALFGNGPQGALPRLLENLAEGGAAATAALEPAVAGESAAHRRRHLLLKFVPSRVLELAVPVSAAAMAVESAVLEQALEKWTRETCEVVCQKLRTDVLDAGAPGLLSGAVIASLWHRAQAWRTPKNVDSDAVFQRVFAPALQAQASLRLDFYLAEHARLCAESLATLVRNDAVAAADKGAQPWAHSAAAAVAARGRRKGASDAPAAATLAEMTAMLGDDALSSSAAPAMSMLVPRVREFLALVETGFVSVQKDVLELFSPTISGADAAKALAERLSTGIWTNLDALHDALLELLPSLTPLRAALAGHVAQLLATVVRAPLLIAQYPAEPLGAPEGVDDAAGRPTFGSSRRRSSAVAGPPAAGSVEAAERIRARFRTAALAAFQPWVDHLAADVRVAAVDYATAAAWDTPAARETWEPDEASGRLFPVRLSRAVRVPLSRAIAGLSRVAGHASLRELVVRVRVALAEAWLDGAFPDSTADTSADSQLQRALDLHVLWAILQPDEASASCKARKTAALSNASKADAAILEERAASFVARARLLLGCDLLGIAPSANAVATLAPAANRAKTASPVATASRAARFSLLPVAMSSAPEVPAKAAQADDDPLPPGEPAGPAPPLSASSSAGTLGGPEPAAGAVEAERPAICVSVVRGSAAGGFLFPGAVYARG